jgi:hypothetical protein
MDEGQPTNPLSPRQDVRICLSAFRGAKGYRVIFCQPEPNGTIWILSIMMFDEPMTETLIEIFQMRLNVVLERMHVSNENPFGMT